MTYLTALQNIASSSQTLMRGTNSWNGSMKYVGTTSHMMTSALVFPPIQILYPITEEWFWNRIVILSQKSVTEEWFWNRIVYKKKKKKKNGEGTIL